MGSKEEGSQQRGLGGMVNYCTLLIIGQPTNQYGKHINHKGRYDSMEDDVQHMEANRVQASCQEVVQSATERTIPDAKCMGITTNVCDKGNAIS